MALILILAGLVVFDVLAMLYGFDSRRTHTLPLRADWKLNLRLHAD